MPSYIKYSSVYPLSNTHIYTYIHTHTYADDLLNALLTHTSPQCDGPDHFVRNTRRLKGRRGLMVDTLLQSRGWRVLRVPYADYEGARGAAGKLALLKTLLEREGVALPGSPTAMESADGAAAAAAFAAGGMGPGTSATSGDREAQRAAEAQTRE